MGRRESDLVQLAPPPRPARASERSGAERSPLDGQLKSLLPERLAALAQDVADGRIEKAVALRRLDQALAALRAARAEIDAQGVIA